MNRFYIGRGNNYMIVRSVIKQRWWWSMNDCEDFYEVNFLWTQWRKNKHLCILETKNPVTDKAMLDLKKQVEDEHNNELYSDTESEQVDASPKDNLAQNDRDDYYKNKIYNRLENNFHLSNKKALFWNVTEYYKSINKDPWDALPVTFHIDNGLDDPEYYKFLEFEKKLEKEIIWKTQLKQQTIRKRKEEAQNTRKRRSMSESESSFTSTESEYSDYEESSDDDEFKIPKNMWIVKPGENSNRGNGIQVCSSLAEINSIVKN